MALRQTATNGANSSATTLVLTFGSSVAAGSLIVLSVNMNSPISLSSVTAGSGDTVSWVTNGLGTGHHFYFGYIQNTVGGYTTITLNLSGTGWQVEAIAREYTGVQTASILDQSTGQTNSSTTSWSSGAMAATTNAADLIVSAMGLANTPATMTASGSYGNLITSNVETGYASSMEDQTVAATGTYTGTMTASVNASGFMSVAAFKTNSMPNITEAVTTSENVTVAIKASISVSESTTTSESYLSKILTSISVSDSTTTSETIKAAFVFLLSVSDSVTTDDSQVQGVTYTGPAGLRVNVSDSTTTSETVAAGVHPYTNMPLISAEASVTSETVGVQIISAARTLPYLQENVKTYETYNINTQTVTGWATVNATLYQNNFGPVVNNSGQVTTQGGAGSYLFQQTNCTVNTQYVTQCQVRGIPSTTVTMAAVQNNVVLSSATVTMDGGWDTISVPAFNTNPVNTSFQVRIYTQSAATINVGAVMTQLGVGALTSYYDGSSNTTASYKFTWAGSPYVSVSNATPVGSAVIVASFEDDNGSLPVTAVDLPVYNNPNLDSSFLTNLNQDSTGITGSSFISILTPTLNGSTYTMTFINTYTQPIYITQCTLFGTPAKVVYSINQEYKDPTSIALYGTNPTNNGQTLVINNDLIQDPSTALSDAYSLVNDYAKPYQRMVADVFPAYHLQVGDNVNITIDDTGQTQTYTVVGVTNGVGTDGGPTQSLEVEVKNLVHYFTINQSIVGGTDSIAP